MLDRNRGLVVFGAIVVTYYTLVDPKIVGYSRIIVKHLPLNNRYSLGELDSVTKLALAGVSQAVLCIGLFVAFRIELRDLFMDGFNPILLICGLLLGIGEAGLSWLLSYVGMRSAMLIAPD